MHGLNVWEVLRLTPLLLWNWVSLLFHPNGTRGRGSVGESGARCSCSHPLWHAGLLPHLPLSLFHSLLLLQSGKMGSSGSGFRGSFVDKTLEQVWGFAVLEFRVFTSLWRAIKFFIRKRKDSWFFHSLLASLPVTAKPLAVRRNFGYVDGMGTVEIMESVGHEKKKHIQIFQPLQWMIVGIRGPNPWQARRLWLENEEGFMPHLSASLCMDGSLEIYRYSIPLLDWLFSTHPFLQARVSQVN